MSDPIEIQPIGDIPPAGYTRHASEIVNSVMANIKAPGVIEQPALPDPAPEKAIEEVRLGEEPPAPHPDRIHLKNVVLLDGQPSTTLYISFNRGHWDLLSDETREILIEGVQEFCVSSLISVETEVFEYHPDPDQPELFSEDLEPVAIDQEGRAA